MEEGLLLVLTLGRPALLWEAAALAPAANWVGLAYS